MKQILKRIVWLIIAFTPVLFWFEIYKAWTTEYDENWGHFFLSVIISFVTVGLLIAVRNDYLQTDKLKRSVRFFSILLATPLTVGIIILYQMTIPMQWKWSGSYIKDGQSYAYIKRRNYFKAENYLIIDNLSAEPDTIKAIVSRNGEELVRLKDGTEIKVQLTDLKKLTDRQLKKLREY